jgi:FMN phosphatase YigB (HAD superfamily)
LENVVFPTKLKIAAAEDMHAADRPEVVADGTRERAWKTAWISRRKESDAR